MVALSLLSLTWPLMVQVWLPEKPVPEKASLSGDSATSLSPPFRVWLYGLLCR